MPPLPKHDDAAPHVGYSVVMPPERHVPVALSELVDTVRLHIAQADRSKYDDVCQLVEACALTEFNGVRRRMKKNFRFFSAAALHKDVASRKGRHMRREDAMNEQEITFLKDFVELMDVAHYQVMSEADWLAVKQERLMLDMPMKINWDHMDDRMLKRFYARYPQYAEDQYRFKDHALIFHRGVGVVRKKEQFFAQKLDLLVAYLVAYPAKQAFYRLAPYLGSYCKQRAEHYKQKDADMDVAPDTIAAGSRAELSHKHAKHINRVALRRVMPGYSEVFGKLFQEVEIVEPTYKDIVTLYRKRVEAPDQKEVHRDPTLAFKFRRDQRGIVVKRFAEIPIADLEIVLPDKTIGLKLIDLLTLYGTAAGAVIGGVTAFFGASVELSVVLSTLGVVGGKLFQTYTNMQAKKADLMKQMSQTLYDVSLASQEGVLFSVLDEMADQTIKEMLLAYFLLLKHKEPVTERELDELCETYLEEKFDAKIDFAVEESLPRLLQDGLVEPVVSEDGLQRMQAVPLEAAHLRLQEKWQRAFVQSLNDDSKSLASTMRTAVPQGGMASQLAGLRNMFGSKRIDVRVAANTAPLPGEQLVVMEEGEGAHSPKKRGKLRSWFHSKKDKKRYEQAAESAN